MSTNKTKKFYMASFSASCPRFNSSCEPDQEEFVRSKSSDSCPESISGPRVEKVRLRRKSSSFHPSMLQHRKVPLKTWNCFFIGFDLIVPGSRIHSSDLLNSCCYRRKGCSIQLPERYIFLTKDYVVAMAVADCCFYLSHCRIIWKISS